MRRVWWICGCGGCDRLKIGIKKPPRFAPRRLLYNRNGYDANYAAVAGAAAAVFFTLRVSFSLIRADLPLRSRR